MRRPHCFYSTNATFETHIAIVPHGAILPHGPEETKARRGRGAGRMVHRRGAGVHRCPQGLSPAPPSRGSCETGHRHYISSGQHLAQAADPGVGGSSPLVRAHLCEPTCASPRVREARGLLDSSRTEEDTLLEGGSSALRGGSRRGPPLRLRLGLGRSLGRGRSSSARGAPSRAAGALPMPVRCANLLKEPNPTPPLIQTTRDRSRHATPRHCVIKVD